MSRWPDATARAALRAYRGAQPGDRLHVLVRWFSCPFPPIVDVLPSDGRVLGVGCGHGLFSHELPRRSAGVAGPGAGVDPGKKAVWAAAEPGDGGRRRLPV